MAAEAGLETPITLSADNQSVALRQVRDLTHALATVAEGLKSPDGLSGELAVNVFKVIEYNLADLSKLLGIATQTAAEIEERHAGIRAANLRIHQLEAQLGAGQSPELVQLALRTMTDRLQDWWKKLDGFGHVSDIDFAAYGCEVKFSCSLFGSAPLIDSPTPVSDQERRRLWLASLAKRGFVVVTEGFESFLVDCDQTRRALLELFAARLPSARVHGFENRWTREGKSAGFKLCSVTVHIGDLADIMALPQPPATAAEKE